jgi:hypothetical protein
MIRRPTINGNPIEVLPRGAAAKLVCVGAPRARAYRLPFCNCYCSVSMWPSQSIITMKCRECAKIIPDGFTDCPWCGAAQPLPSLASTIPAVSQKPLASAESTLLTAAGLVLSLAFLLGCSFIAIKRDEAASPFANPAYFRGEWMGTFFWVIILAAIYAAIRNRRIGTSSKLLIIFGTGFLLSALILARPARHLPAEPSRAALRQFVNDIKSPDFKWNAPTRAFLRDLISRDQQYVAEISKLDETAKPLYTAESFRDVTTVQEMIDQLRLRLAVADKYADLEPVLAKLNKYVEAVDGSESEKREFMEGFASTLPKTRAAFKAWKDKEHAWLQVSVDLYQFALAKNGKYSLQNGILVFEKPADLNIFNQRLARARDLHAEFLLTYREIRRAQQTMADEMGLEGSEFDPHRSH